MKDKLLFLLLCVSVLCDFTESGNPHLPPTNGGGGLRVTRTSGGYSLNLRNNNSQSSNITKASVNAGATSFTPTKTTVNVNNTRTPGSTLRSREQYLFNVFEVIVSTLETKLQRIENLDKAVEHLMRRVEALDSRLSYNIDKTDSVIMKLRNLDAKLFQFSPKIGNTGAIKIVPEMYAQDKLFNVNIDGKLVSLDQKVSDIDSKLIRLKSQLDSNFLASDDINAEASEKKYVNTNAPEGGKLLNAELEAIRATTNNIDKKLQFHMSSVSDNLANLHSMMTDLHEAVVEPLTIQQQMFKSNNGTTTTTSLPPTIVKSSKIDRLVRQMHPILSVSEKMDEVWDVVVGTKTSVDDLVPKSNELLTQTQRQERAINDIHEDLRQNTDKIIANLDIVERRLKKQEDDVVTLAQRPVAAELLLDPTIDRLVEYDQSRYNIISEESQPTYTESAVPPTYTSPTVSVPTISTTSTTTTTSSPFLNPNSINIQAGTPMKTSTVRNRGVIFPSVKNKPSPTNTTFTSDVVYPSLKDVKGYSCQDLINNGMRQSGVYYLQIRGTAYWYLKVYCEQDIADGGWTVIHRRDDFGIRENFNRDWNDYKNGFGDLSKEFWLGNENIYMLTNNEEYSLRVELEDFEGNKRYAQYSHFKIYSEGEYYKLEIDGYDGNAGDSLNDPWYGSNNSPFSTYNRDNDRSSLNCASMLKGGWWWRSCGRGLNGLYLTDPQDLTARQGIVWFRWRGWDYTLKKAMMMIRPRGVTPST
ncbi:angiopoietin-2 [Planococcus citri]|uniref:angiopoietin-2 n=1 Tax=Planococcus citri TaxID=170843 RepID=UPI0031F7CF64